MPNELNIALVQSDIIWQNTSENFHHLDKLLSSVKDSNLIILPEMFNTGFSMNPEQISMPENGGEVVEWMIRKAKDSSAAIIGSVAVKEKEGFYNRLYFVQPNGEITFYNKRHLFRMAGENAQFLNGEDRLIVEYKGWKICPQICYDLRFPVFSRNTYKENAYDYDVLIYVANWPEARSLAWRRLLQARSIENLCYTVGVNRVGEDGNSFKYSGDSRCFNYSGERLDEIDSKQEMIQLIKLDKEALIKFRKKFPTGLDADDFQIT